MTKSMTGFDDAINGDPRTNGAAEEFKRQRIRLFSRVQVFLNAAQRKKRSARHWKTADFDNQFCGDVSWISREISGPTSPGNFLHTHGTPWRILPYLQAARSSRHRRHKSRRRLYMSDY